MTPYYQERVSLEHFDGTIDFLLYLVQKNEVDIFDVPISQLTDQYLQKLSEYKNSKKNLDSGAEFLGITSFLLWLKSKSLLPKEEMETDEEEAFDPRFEIIHQLLEYSCFKDVAKDLSKREQRQNSFYTRGIKETPQPKKGLGVAHLSLEDLSQHFRAVWSKAQVAKGKIHEEEWLVADKVKYLKSRIKEEKKIAFTQVFSKKMVKGELIVTFLAILELMKLGKIMAVLIEKQPYLLEQIV